MTTAEAQTVLRMWLTRLEQDDAANMWPYPKDALRVAIASMESRGVLAEALRRIEMLTRGPRDGHEPTEQLTTLIEQVRPVAIGALTQTGEPIWH